MTGTLWLQPLPCRSGAATLFQRRWWLLGASLATTCLPWRSQTSSWFPVSPRLWGKLVCTEGLADPQLACTGVFRVNLEHAGVAPLSRRGPSPAGAGVQGSLHRDGQPRHVRFGSVAFVADALPDTEAEAVRALQHRQAGAIASVLVDLPQQAPSPQRGGASPGASPSGAQQAPPVIRLFTFDDSVHQQSAEAVAALEQGSWRTGTRRQADAVRVVMLTGDRTGSAHRVAQQLGISHVRAELTPEQKLEVRQLKQM